MTPLARAIRAGCDDGEAPTCTWPECECVHVPSMVKAALAAIAEPSEEMVEAGRIQGGDFTGDGVSESEAAIIWEDMHAKMMEE